MERLSQSASGILAHIRSKPLLKIALLLIGIFGSSLLLKKAPSLEVLVAKNPLKTGHVIKKKDLAVLTVDPRFLPGGTIPAQDGRTLIGKKVTRLYGAGELLTWSGLEGGELTPTDMIPKGMRLIIIPINNLREVRGYLEGNERVDLLFAPNNDRDKGKTYTLLQNVSTYSASGPSSNKNNKESENSESSGNLLGFVLPMDQAMLVTHARHLGNFSILLRSPLDQRTSEKGIEVTNAKLFDVLNRQQPKDKGIEIIYGLSK